MCKIYVGIPTYDDFGPEPSFVRSVDMPWPDQFRKAVLFIGTRENDRFVPKATAFRVLYHFGGLKFGVLVTAEHVISGLLTKNFDIWIRLTLKNGQTAEMPIEASAWIFHPDEQHLSDVAVCPLGDYAINPVTNERVEMDVVTLAINGPTDIAATDEIVNARKIGIGDEIGIIGLFRSHYGLEKNIPVLRIGNIAAMRGEPIHTKYAGYIDAYLVEARSIGGLSGSPVLVSMMNRSIEGNPDFGAGLPAYYLLGLMHGHFDVANLHEDVVTEDSDGSTTGIHTGMGVVIPVHKIIETVEHPDMKKHMQEQVDRTRAKRGATPDLIDDGHESPPATDENPNAREDFMRLQGVAARKQKPAD